MPAYPAKVHSCTPTAGSAIKASFVPMKNVIFLFRSVPNEAVIATTISMIRPGETSSAKA